MRYMYPVMHNQEKIPIKIVLLLRGVDVIQIF